VPAVETTTELGAAVSRFPAGERGLEVTAAARAAAQEALARSGRLRPARLAEEDGELVLDLPVASEATVPQRPLPRHP